MLSFLKNILYRKAKPKAPLSGMSTDEIKELADKNYPINYVKDSAELKSLKGLVIKDAEKLWWDATPRFKLAIDKDTTKEQIQSFFDTIPNNFEVFFFDFFHPQISDPGAYVTSQRNGVNFLYMLGNHGWSNEWKEIGKSELVEYLYKNREYNIDELKIYRLYQVAKNGKRAADY